MIRFWSALRDGDYYTFLGCDECCCWEVEVEFGTNIHALNDIALRHEASVGHLLRVMGSVS